MECYSGKSDDNDIVGNTKLKYLCVLLDTAIEPVEKETECDGVPAHRMGGELAKKNTTMLGGASEIEIRSLTKCKLAEHSPCGMPLCASPANNSIIAGEETANVVN